MKGIKARRALETRRKEFDATSNKDGRKRPGSLSGHKQGSVATHSGPSASTRSRTAVGAR